MLILCQLTWPSMPLIPASASCKVAYLTKPKPFENPDTRSQTTFAAKGKEIYHALCEAITQNQLSNNLKSKLTIDHISELLKGTSETLISCTFAESWKCIILSCISDSPAYHSTIRWNTTADSGYHRKTKSIDLKCILSIHIAYHLILVSKG